MSSRHTEDSLYQRDNARTQLFGTIVDRKPANGDDYSASPYAKNTKFDYDENTLSQLESQSDEQMGQMGKRIQALKSLSLRMGDEIKNGNHSLNDLGSTFENTKVKLKDTFGNMMDMAKRSRISIKTWLLIFSFVGIMFFWVWIT
ncbi:similar to Saccharomyces cerevisiae YIL004C BET1 Type II membrane protein required for vesicular transport between the endoplasmic reticulum and Golgi complex [Maudiozyma saulgeensis]|uniref:Similar to Saccharomyces cerevisiae YIL004C BET1 Type II membrane protein required for vesicular transport between the endoplasmic reticulum and Golgi complex n=1 Tax=Maudiozyma saulgeensis TaxID=1789683 RepID=A0A1X7QXH3_9SACH|nr:similar to Saccharomyces cerevisiae YIL004C BET1 Type II membrane protein required for vesicular transport between the endoplasmic reticulum and Golgi complex [Kazachstania saulgeensis]